MSILVTGGTGFVGIHVVAQLAELGEPVVALSAEGEMDESSRDFLGPARERVACVKGDVLDMDTLRRAIERHDVERIIHGAAITAIGDLEPDAARQAAVVNVGGTATVLEAARLAGVKRFVHLSSASVYGATDPDIPLEEDATLAPRGIYGITKRAGEDVVRRYFEIFGMEGAVLRPLRPLRSAGTPQSLAYRHVAGVPLVPGGVERRRSRTGGRPRARPDLRVGHRPLRGVGFPQTGPETSSLQYKLW